MLLLPADLLVLVAEAVLRQGDAFWFAMVSHACRVAVDTACDRLGVRFATHASSAFRSEGQLALAMLLPRFRALVHANMLAASAQTARPHTLNRQWTWSPAGERALVAGSPLAALDFLWYNWGLSVDTLNPGCFLSVASHLGRVDLLSRMYAMGPKLKAMINRSTTAHEAHMTPIVRGIMVQALASGRFDAIRWYHARCEEHEKVVVDAMELVKSREETVSDLWRSVLATHYDRHMPTLVQAAAAGADPFASLNFLCNWIWPRFGSRTRLASGDDHVLRIVGIVWTMAAASASPTATGAWQWMLSVAIAYGHQLLQFSELLRHLTDTHAAQLVIASFEPRQVAAYRWLSLRLRERDDWAHDAWQTVWNSGDEAIVVAERGFSPRLRFALHAARHIVSERNADFGRYWQSGAWLTDRDVLRQALVDACVWGWEREAHLQREEPTSDSGNENSRAWMAAFRNDTLVHTEQLLAWDADGFTRLVCEVYARQDEMRFARGYTLRGLTEILVKWMTRSPHYTIEMWKKLSAAGVMDGFHERAKLHHPCVVRTRAA